MQKSTIILCSVLLVMLVLFGYVTWSNVDDAPMTNDAVGGHGHAAMMREMGDIDHRMMMVESEREFLAGMIPHHQEAVDTAKQVLERGGSIPAMVTLAENIVESQIAEIELMKGWYADWYGEAYVETNDYAPMMRDLTQLEGAALDRVFLEDMIMHHMGAIMMAESVVPHIEHEELRTLATAITSAQREEMMLMRSLLGQLERE